MDQLCSTPSCGQERVEGRRFCQPCADNLDRIRKEMDEDPLLLYNQRSGARNLGGAPVRPKRPPTCCKTGCFEIREQGKAFCFAHEDEEEDAA